ncbi:MAG: hypothetical protein IIZ67_01745 [Bacilli bacterium]|jgi:uncharacterized protein YoxC|nr:hypothetical protein [Bacilli bacterium]
MVDLNSLLITLLYVAGFVLLVVFIIIGIKLIGILNKVDRVMDDVEDKVSSLNGVFHAVDKFSDNINTISETIVSNVVGFISKMFGKKKSIIDEEDDF